MLRKWDIKNDQIRKQCVDEVIARMDEEDDSHIGVIAAQDIIDIVSQYYGPNAYNMGIDDSKKLIQTKLSDLEIDLDIIKVSI